jgi:hypothetical protein
VDYSRFAPAIDPVFNLADHPVTSAYYWSSTTYVHDRQFAWLIRFWDGLTTWSYVEDVCCKETGCCCNEPSPEKNAKAKTMRAFVRACRSLTSP